MSAHLQRALVLIQQERFPLAEEELRLALTQEPENPQAHAFLALCLSQREQFEPATQEAREAIQRPGLARRPCDFGPGLPGTQWSHRGRAGGQGGPALDPEDVDHYDLLARIALAERDWARALDWAERGLAVDAENVQCANLRAMALTKLGRAGEAAQAVEAALKRAPQNALSHTNLGWTALHQGDHKKALEHFREALRLDPESGYAKAGLVEALKAHYFLYGLMLRYFLWMARQSSKMQWGIILGLFIGQRVLWMLADQNPAWNPWIQPIIIAYVVFAVLTWVTGPLFNLLLRLNPYRRYALSRDQRWGSTLFGVMLVPALGSLLYWALTGSELGMLASLYFGLLLLPVTAIFRCSRGWPRWLMALCTLVLATLIPAAILAMPYDQELAGNLFQGFFWGSILSQFAANFLMMATVRR